MSEVIRAKIHRLNDDALMRRRCRADALRKRYGLTYAQIGERIGVSEAIVRDDIRIINGILLRPSRRRKG